ncbi:MAG: hypothetical protein ABW154_07745 [Dyella sp.]
MRELPILMSAPMVRAILAGSKTVTRRVVKPYRDRPIVNLAEAEPTLGFSGKHNDPDSWGYEYLDDGAPAPLSAWPELCPYGQPGDRLWVREAWTAPASLDDKSGAEIAESCLAAGYRVPWCPIRYEADGALKSAKDWREFGSMPGEAVPGRYRHARFMPRWASRITLEVTAVRVERLQDISDEQAIAEGVCPDENGFGGTTALFAELWESINGAGSWDANPWVWAIEFKRVMP